MGAGNETYRRRNGLSKEMLATSHCQVYQPGADAVCPRGYVRDNVGDFVVFRKPSVRLVDLLVSLFSPDFFEGCSAEIVTDLRGAVLSDSDLSLKVMGRMQQYHPLRVMLEEFSKRYNGDPEVSVADLLKKRDRLRQETRFTEDGVAHDKARAVGAVCERVCPVPDGFGNGGLRS
jgi:hypothetical protein